MVGMYIKDKRKLFHEEPCLKISDRVPRIKGDQGRNITG
jgi:hypothetical protein